MKLLFLPAYFRPEEIASSRFIECLHKELARQNFEMEVFAPSPSRGISDETRAQYRLKKEEVLYDGKLKVFRFNMIRERNNPLQKTFRYICCYFIQKRKGEHAKNIDLIFVASTPPIQGMMAAKVKKKLNVPLVYCLQDIFPDSLVGTGLTKKGSLLWKIGRKIEDYTYKNADKIIVISENFKQNIIKKGVPEEKIEVVYNWVDEKSVQPIPKEDNYLFDEFDLSRNDFHVVYAGNLGHAQNLDVIINAAKKLINIESLKFLIFGSGGVELEIREKIGLNKLDNISLLPLQPKERISYVYSLGDLSVVSCKPGLGGSAFPSKTWNIMSSGTAVLANFDPGTELQEIIEEKKVGFFSEAGNVDSFCEKILYCFNNRDICNMYGINGRNFILNNLTKEIGTKKYIQIFKEVIENN